jgi:hypothetical protein
LLLELVADCLWSGDWAQMRALLSRSPVGTLLSERCQALRLLMISDPLMTPRRVDIAEQIADLATEGDARFRDAAGNPADLMMLAMTGSTTAAPFLASRLLRGHLERTALELAATATSDIDERTAALVLLVGDLDGFAESLPDHLDDLQALVLSCEHAAVGQAVVAARPRTTLGYQLQLEFFSWLVEDGGWRPASDAASRMFRAVVAVAEAVEDFSAIPPAQRLRTFLRGYARGCVERNRGRCAALVSLVEILNDADAEAIGRAIFESARSGDLALLGAILDVVRWPEHERSPETIGDFHYAITPALLRLVAARDQARWRDSGGSVRCL